MTIELIETDNYKTLYTKQITLPLSDVPRFTPYPTPKPTPTPVPASYYYDTLTRGDKGDGVAQMQMELIDLGYLTGSADGVFGPQTAEAVRLFSEANGLTPSEIATPEMQQKLFGYGAKPYKEPWIPLVFGSDATCSWKKKSGNKFNARVEVTNTSRTRTIKAFELYAYAEDVYGDRVYGNTTYYATTSRKVKPGKTVYSDYMLLPSYSQVDTIHFAIKKVVFDDGTVHESDDPGYWYWEVYH